jgi:hypothetical protein
LLHHAHVLTCGPRSCAPGCRPSAARHESRIEDSGRQASERCCLQSRSHATYARWAI